MKKSFVKDSLLFTKYLLLFVSLLIFGFKILTYGRIQTTLREQERNKIKQYKSKEQFDKAYFRRRTEARRAEIISARLGSAWHASVLDEENIAVLKQFYWWYLIKDNFKVKENINNSLSN